jgi:phospholipid-transporting ATPase
LKIKQGLPQTAKLLSPSEISKLEGTYREIMLGEIEYEQPNNSLYTFDGTMTIYGGQSGPQNFPLDPSQTLLRGAMLRNTNWIYGVVIFTGHETKLMRNASATPIKRTSVEKMTNVQILFLFAILITLSVSCAGGALYMEVTLDLLTESCAMKISLLTPKSAKELPTFSLIFLLF